MISALTLSFPFLGTSYGVCISQLIIGLKGIIGIIITYNTQHALRPYIDSEMNHIRHFIKIPFINKGVDFIDLPSIFRDNTVESYIPDYFENTEPPIICYKYNKPIRGTIFNFNKLVTNLDIDTKTPDS